MIIVQFLLWFVRLKFLFLEHFQPAISCRSHSELRKHKIVVEEDIGVVSTKICRSCSLSDGIMHDGIYTETLKIHLALSSPALTASQ